MLVFAGSRFTTESERRFAPIEGECLAAAHGLERCRMFTLGCPDLILAVDHKPLTRILNDRQLDSITNPKLLRLKEKTLPYKFRIYHVAGASNVMKTADAISRHPVKDVARDDRMEEEARAFAVHQAKGIDSITWQRVNEAAAVDEECVSLVQQILDGFPDEKTVLPPML